MLTIFFISSFFFQTTIYIHLFLLLTENFPFLANEFHYLNVVLARITLLNLLLIIFHKQRVGTHWLLDAPAQPLLYQFLILHYVILLTAWLIFVFFLLCLCHGFPFYAKISVNFSAACVTQTLFHLCPLELAEYFIACVGTPRLPLFAANIFIFYYTIIFDIIWIYFTFTLSVIRELWSLW